MRKNGNAVFTDEQVRLIKINLLKGVPYSALARQWGCGVETIGRISRGETYRHVEVQGEERLRPAIQALPLAPKDYEITVGKTEAEIDAEADAAFARLMAEANAANAAEEVLSDAEREAKGVVRGFLGKQADALMGGAT